MVKVQIKCVGISPILIDRMTDETLESLRTGVRRNVARDVPVEKVAENKIYRENGDGSRIGLPSSMLFACLREAGCNINIIFMVYYNLGII